MSQPDINDFLLPEDRSEAIFRDHILPTMLANAASQDQPVLVVLTGQPGAGKSTVAREIRSTFSDGRGQSSWTWTLSARSIRAISAWAKSMARSRRTSSRPMRDAGSNNRCYTSSRPARTSSPSTACAPRLWPRTSSRSSAPHRRGSRRTASRRRSWLPPLRRACSASSCATSWGSSTPGSAATSPRTPRRAVRPGSTRRGDTREGPPYQQHRRLSPR